MFEYKLQLILAQKPVTFAFQLIIRFHPSQEVIK